MHVSPSLGCKADGRRRFAASSPSSTTHHTNCCSLFAALDACWIASRRRPPACWSACVKTPPRERLCICSLSFLSLYPPPPASLVDTFWMSFSHWLSGIWSWSGTEEFWVFDWKELSLLVMLSICGASRMEVYVGAGMQRDTRAFFKREGDMVVMAFLRGFYSETMMVGNHDTTRSEDVYGFS